MAVLVLEQNTFAKADEDDFGLILAMLRYGVERNIAAFSMAGLRVPDSVLTWSEISSVPASLPAIRTVVRFQERLMERIAALAGNRRMVEEIWRFNEATRRQREMVLMVPAIGRCLMGALTNLLNALFVGDTGKALDSLDRLYDRYNDHAHSAQRLQRFWV